MVKRWFVNCGLITEVVSADWKKDFFTGAKGMPKTTELVLGSVEDIYFTAFGGEQNVTVINKKMVIWLIGQIHNIGGPLNIGTEEREKLITVMTWFRIAGSEGNLPKMDLNTAFDFSSKKIEEKNKKENLQKTAEDFPEPPIMKVEEEGLVKRVYTIPDGSGRVWVKVDTNRAGEFFDKLCDANKAFGVGCQSKLNGMMNDQHRKSNRTTYTLLGPEKGKKVPISTLMSLSIDTADKNMVESKQVGNQPIGTNLYGWDDLFEKFVEFLGTPVAKQTIDKTTDSYTFSMALNNRKFDAMNKLDLLRPDFITNSKNQIINSKQGKEWFEERNLDALEALTKLGPKSFLEKIESYTKSITFKEALKSLSLSIPGISKTNPDLVLSKVDYLLDFLPAEEFKRMFEHVNLENYITTKKVEFEKLLKKLTNVNSAESKSYKEIFKSILDNYFIAIVNAFGGSKQITVGIDKFMDFLEMPKSDKHTFVKRNPDGKIIAHKKDISVNPETHERTETDVEFELGDQLSILPQKDRRDLLKKNEEFIKSKIEGDSERKEINFLRLLFRESNPQDVQRNLKSEKEKFIGYYENPSHITKYNVLRGVQLPGIFEFYKIFNKGTISKSAEGEKEKPYIKFDLEDVRNPEIAKTIVSFFAKLYMVDNPSSSKESPDFYYTVYSDYTHMLEEAGESKEKIEEFIKRYKPTSLKMFKGNNLPIPLTVYEKYYDFLSYFTSEDVAKDDIKNNKEEIISRTNNLEFNKLLGKFSTIKYNVSVGDFVEFLGRDIKRQDEKKYFTLQAGRKYSVMDVDERIIGELANTRIKVMGGDRKVTDWLDIKAFKWEEYGKIIMNESLIIRKFIKKKLLETYNKNKK